MKVFVTGAAGALGRALTSSLTARGIAVRGLVRRKNGIAVLRQLGAEPIEGDLTSEGALAEAMAGCDVVYHLAQFFDFWSESADTFGAVNVTGTRHVLQAAVAARVPRLVFSSSAITIGERPGEHGKESTRHRGYTLTAFERSVLTAERLATSFQRHGLEVVVANPALVVAPADRGWIGRLLARCLAGEHLYAPSVTVGWISATDAAEGLSLVAERGEAGERYILSGETQPFSAFLSRVARVAGRPPAPSVSAPVAVVGAQLATALATATARRPWLSTDEARFFRHGFRVDGTRVVSELGLRYTPASKYLPAIVRSYQRMKGE